MPPTTRFALPPRARRRLTTALCAAAPLVGVGCSGYRAAPQGAPPAVRAAVRVRFAVPRAVAALHPRGDTLEVPGVRAVTGQVVAARGDTLVLWVAEMDPSAAQVHGWRTTVVRTAGDQVSVRQENTEGSLFLVGVLAGAAVLSLAILSSLSGSD